MEQSDIQHRDRVLRAYFEGRDWDQNNEFALKRSLILKSHDLLPDYPYVIEDEWEVEPGRTDKGRGDLVFTNGTGGFAVVEVKWIDLDGSGRNGRTKRTSNRQKRRAVEEQAIDYAEKLSQKLGISSIQALIFTNQLDRPQLANP